ncbi:late cornified envelope protein 2D-like [Choloepus didactylus]|uniref:late cornified envelope protein 2D-like n=1 Tax=Choloepus didactylus TaxID=27675 RepID=UPI00189CE7C9|nr:late cornified envelope protein 2D-like [Choloepus didactylus]
MSCQQSKQKCQLPAKCIPKCSPKCPPKAPQVPALCPAPCPAPASSCCVPSGGGSSCVASHWLPRVHLHQPQCPNCCESESSGSSSCCHGSRGCC